VCLVRYHLICFAYSGRLGISFWVLGNKTGLGGHYWGSGGRGFISYAIAVRLLIPHTCIGWPSCVVSAPFFNQV
jgi:hypothetical protein